MILENYYVSLMIIDDCTTQHISHRSIQSIINLSHPGGEFKLRYEAQLELNSKLEEQTEWYLEEVDKTREKIKKG